MPKVFISHRWAEGEHEFARELKKKLENYEGITALLDEYEMLPGDTIKDWMDDAIQKGCDVFLFVLSPHSLESENCLYELDLALQTELPIIPIYIREVEIPERLKGILYADFRRDLILPFYLVDRLVSGIRRQSERSQQRKSSTDNADLTITSRKGYFMISPGQIIEYLDEKFVFAKRQCDTNGAEGSHVYIERGYAAIVSNLLMMIDSIPPENLALRGESLIEFHQGVNAIRMAVNAWSHGDDKYKLKANPGEKWHPLALIRKYLLTLTDERF